MRNEAEIQDRIRMLLNQEFESRVAAISERLPCRCIYNHRQPLDTRKQVDGEPNENYNRIERHGLPVAQTIGLCMFGAERPDEWPGTICEEPIDAQRCPPKAFTPRETKEGVKKTFEANIRDLTWVKENMPEVFALLWALGTETKPPEESIPPPPPSPTPETPSLPPPPPLPWWKRFILKLLSIKLDATPRLPPGEG